MYQLIIGMVPLGSLGYLARSYMRQWKLSVSWRRLLSIVFCRPPASTANPISENLGSDVQARLMRPFNSTFPVWSGATIPITLKLLMLTQSLKLACAQ